MQVRIENGGDGNGAELDTEIAGEGPGIGFAAFGGIRAGHGDAEDVGGAEGFDGYSSDNGGIDTAAEADDGLGEIAFANVIASAEDEGLVGAGDFVGEAGRGYRLRR